MAEIQSSPTDLRKTLPQSLEEARASCDLSLQHLPQPLVSPRIPGYDLDQALGQGAFAEVWRATQLRTQKKVALKIFKLHSGPLWLFLQREVERLSLLDKHPGIVSLLDADLTGEPPYYTMDLLERGSLQSFVDSGVPVDPARVARWMEEVCRALAYVHARGLIHCDLKPANILLDDEDHARLMDFGHSRILTASSGTLGTFFYMAPEQTLLADAARVIPPDVRWDLFAIGSTFFALLSGRTPWSEIESDLKKEAHLSGKLQAFRDAVARSPLPNLHRLTQGRVDRELAAIVAKCCEADPGRRYASATEILADLQARREGRPVSVLAQNKPYVALKFFRRHKPAFAVLALALAGLVGWGAYRAWLEEKRLQAQLSQFYALRGRERAAAGDPLSAAAYEDAAYQASPSRVTAWSLQYHLPAAPLALLRTRRGLKPSFLPDGQRVLLGWRDGALALVDLKTGKQDRLFTAPSPIRGAQLSPDGSLLAAASEDGGVRLWDLASGQLKEPVLHGAGAPVLAWSSDGQRLAGASDDGMVQVWDLAQASSTPLTTKLAGPAQRLAFSPDGGSLACLGWDDDKKKGVLDLLACGQDLRPVADLGLAGAGTSAEFLDQGGGLAVMEPNGHARILRHQRSLFGSGWALSAEIKHPAQAPLLAALAKGGRTFVRLEADGHLRLWTLSQGKAVPMHLGSSDLLLSAALDPSGSRLATLSKAHDLRLWDLGTRRPIGKALHLGREARSLALVGPGQALVFSPPSAREWDLERGEPLGRAFYCEAEEETLAAPGGRWLLQFPEADSGDALIVPISRPESYALDFPYRRPGGQGGGRAALSPDGKTLLTAYGARARFWDLGTGKPLGAEIRSLGAFTGLCFDPASGQAALLGAKEGRLYDVSQGAKALQAFAWQGAPVAACFLPGPALVTGDSDGNLSFWDAGSPLPKAIVSRAAPALFSLAYDEDRKAIRCLTRGGLLLLGLDGKSRAKPQALAPGYQRFSLSRNGASYLALGGRELRVYDARTAKPLADPLLLEDEPSCVALSDDNTVIAAAFKDGGFRLLDAQSGQALGERFSTPAPAADLSFSHDGRSVLAASANGVQRLWKLPWLRRKTPTAQSLHARALVATHAQVGATGELESIPYGDWKKAWRQAQEEAHP